jgi:hypothetical protein
MPHTLALHVGVLHVPGIGQSLGALQPTQLPAPSQTPMVPHTWPFGLSVVTTAMFAHESMTQGFVLAGTSVLSATTLACPATHCSILQSPGMST